MSGRSFQGLGRRLALPPSLYQPGSVYGLTREVASQAAGNSGNSEGDCTTQSSHRRAGPDSCAHFQMLRLFARVCEQEGLLDPTGPPGRCFQPQLDYTPPRLLWGPGSGTPALGSLF